MQTKAHCRERTVNKNDNRIVAERQENYEKNAEPGQAEKKKERKKRKIEINQVDKEIRCIPARSAEFHFPKSGD